MFVGAFGNGFDAFDVSQGDDVVAIDFCLAWFDTAQDHQGMPHQKQSPLVNNFE